MKSVIKIISALLLTALSGPAVFTADAEPLELIYEHYSSDDGLPHNSICDMLQDHNGYLWLCTWYGLSRYDGSTFVNYTMVPGDYSILSHNRITDIEEDVNGRLWVMTYDYHLYFFDVNDEKFIAIPSGLDGLHESNLRVDDFHCASDGSLWAVLSGAGLMRVDADLNHMLYLGDGVPVGKNISSIHEDSEGNIYVVSESGVSIISDDKASLLSRNHEVFAFAEDDDNLIFAAPDQLIIVNKMTREQNTIDLSTLGASDATAITVSGGTVYVGFRDNAVAALDSESHEPVVRRSDMGRVRYLFPDPEGLLWIATERTGIWKYDASTDRFRHFEHSNNVMSYYVDTLARVVTKGDMTWVKMNNWGFGYYDRDRDEIVPLDNVKEQPDCRFMNGVACFEADTSGVLWMSTVGRGLERVTAITTNVDVIVPPTRQKNNISSSEIRAVLRDSKGCLWVAAKSCELYRYSPDMSTCRSFDVEAIGVIYSIFEDNAGNIWLGTKGDGLIRMKPEGDDYELKIFRHDPADRGSLSSDNIYSIEQDNDGRIWVGTYGAGLSMLPTPDSDVFVTVKNNFPDYPQAGQRVRYLHCIPDGRMLVASVSGLILFEPSDRPELTLFNLITKQPGDSASLGNNDVMHIFTDRKGNTWLSTFGGGLNRLYFENGSPEFEVISTDDGLSSNIILSAVDDTDGVIWMATEAGLSSYDPATSVVRNYTRYDGVMPTSFSEATCAALEDGSMVFGTYDNVYRIFPDRFRNITRDSRLVLSGLSIDGVRTPFYDRIVIPHDCSFFSIDFASLDFSTSLSTSFSYILEGYDKKWISGSGAGRATYSRIPPGNYVFKVREAYREEDDPDECLSIKVKVKASVWNSFAANIIYVILVVAAVILMVRLMYSSIRLRGDIRVEQSLNDIKARFFTNVSHELRTPLTLILGGIDDIDRKTGEGDPNEYSVKLVRKNARRMLTLVNQLLDTRSIADGKMKLNVSCFDVVKLVQDVADDFRDMAVERHMELRSVQSVEALMVWGDAMRLEALVYNLMTNAFKYTSDGGRIEVGVLYREGENDFRIMVKDNGIGVPKDNATRIFEPFTKGDVSAFGGMASSGIGLSFCKEIAEMHGGNIWVESMDGKGSRFYVRLPMDRERFSEDIAGFIASADDILINESHGLGKFKVEVQHTEGALKVLVVEDNAELKVFLYNNLVEKYDVRDASNGKEALQIISSGWMPDMIVTDLMMPEMDGIELVDHIRNDFNTSHIPIIMITAKHEDDTQLKVMKYGADGYIAKPFTMELLLARIENMLERRKTLISKLTAENDGSVKEHDGRKSKRLDLSPEEIVITDKDEQLIKKVMSWLEANVADPEITVEQLAAYVGMGRTSMYNKIKGLTGKSPVELIQDFRMEKATYYLKSGQFSVSETSYNVGFSDPGYFSRSFKKHYGMSPADYIKRNKQKNHVI